MGLKDHTYSGSMIDKNGHPLLRELGQKILHHCLVDQKSILTDELIWTQDNFRELKTRYTDNPIETSESFDTKIVTQLQGSSNGARLLFGELYLLHLLVPTNVNPTTKISRIEAVTSLCDPPVRVTDEVRNTIDTGGVLNGGTGYNTSRFRQFWDLIDFGMIFSALPKDERTATASDPKQLAALIFRDSGELKNRAPQIRRAISFLFMPEHFAPITSATHLKKIDKHYGRVLTPEEATFPLERRVAAALKHIQKEKGRDWYFYDERGDWDPTYATVKEVDDIPELTSASTEPDTLQELADELLVDVKWLDGLTEILEAKQQLILYGPPGTGKTFLARKLAVSLAADLSFVQFHPSYSYEDFFEGFRPVADETGAVQLRLRPGPLRRLAEKATANPEEKFFLIIDEINRGNLSKIFGELYFLLEYRDEVVELMYSGDHFTLPTNLFIIATMNSSDRSIALVDSAMRRRFAFIELHPDVNPTHDMLQRWCEGKNVPDDVVGVWKELNRRIGAHADRRDQMIGPSYFMREKATTDEGLNRLWNTEIFPLLDEMFYGQHDRVRKEFSLTDIRAVANPAAGEQ